MPRRSIDHASAASSRARCLVGAELERCIFCQGTAITREGKRYKKLETVQLWYCRTCDRVFRPQRAKGKTYPLKVVLESLMLYYRGETRERAGQRIKERCGIAAPPRTFSTWLAEYRDITTYARLRNQRPIVPRPRTLIRSVRLHHQQVYDHRIRQGKLAAIVATTEHQRLKPMADYLTEMAEACPHKLFQTDVRASQGNAVFDLDSVEIKSRRSHASRVAGLVLQAVTHNKRRHDELQRFMLATDSVTVAVEVPITLSPDDLVHLRDKAGFRVPIESSGMLTGHIDFIQIRHGAVHILNYKPGANSEKPIAQLMVYALALSRRTGLRLYDFACAWFDEHHYFEFYPLHVVHKRGRSHAA